MTEPSRVLIVEDEPSDNQFLTMTVRGLGHAAESVLDGQAAIAWLQENKPSLVFLDALLPKADGFAVLAEIRRLHPDVPVFMMSGVYKKKNYEQEAVGKLGATAYLHKPLAVMQIWEILGRHLPLPVGNEMGRDFPGVPFWRRPLPAVIGDLHLAGHTGLLFVRSTGQSGILFFEDGRVVFGRCNDPQLRVDRVLVQLGKLRKEQLPRVAEIAAQARGRVGEALVAEKMITAEDLNEALAMQQRNHVTSPLTWTDGSCWFFPTDAPRRETFKMQLDVPAMVFWACRHLEVDEHLVRFLPAAERKLRCVRRAEELAHVFGLSPDEVRLVNLADGSRTVAQLRAIGRMMQLDVERILAGLMSLQLVELGPEPKPKPELAPLFGSSVPVAGDLARFPPALLLVSMAFSRKTGVLQLESPGEAVPVHRTIHFTDGDIAFATSSDPADRIGQVLLRVGLLTKDQLQAALQEAQAQQSAALGRILVARGVLHPDDLHAALVHQAQQVVTGLVGWGRGTFRFQENEGPARDIVPLGLDTRQALMTALRTCPFSDIAPRLPSPQTRLRTTATAHQLAADMPLTMLEQRLRREADGSRTVQEIAQATTEGPEAALRAIFSLTTIGLVEGFVLPLGASPPPARSALPASAAAPHRPPLAPADPAETGESTAERARKTHVLAADESFDGGEEASASPAPAEDWSSSEEGSFAGLGDGPSLREDWSSPQEASFAGLQDAPTGAALREDWSAPQEASFSGLSAAIASAAPSAGFSLGEILGELPLDGGGDWPAAGPGGGSGSAAAVAAPALTLAQAAALTDFLVLLAEWTRACPEAVPEGVRSALPRELREMFGL